MNRFTLCLIFIIALVNLVSTQNQDQDQENQWNDYKIKHGKKYKNPQEEKDRKARFTRRVSKMNAHNVRYQQGLETYAVGVNKFTDMSEEERAVYLGTNQPENFTLNNSIINVAVQATKPVSLPSKVDWRTQGYVTPVVNQGGCGSCWSFSVVAALEGQYKKKTGKLMPFSQQNLLDCAKNMGCDGGGWIDKGFEYIKTNQGIATSATYPYEGTKKTCRFNRNAVGTTISNYINTPRTDDGLKNAVATIGPISVQLNADGFFSYKSGVYSNPSCSMSTNHAVTLVGYDMTAPTPFWIIKNSWGTDFGEQGYIKVAMTPNMCGISTFGGYYPVM